ncbi:hypothetical protein AAFC00_005726 [Neodothiora populina]|uniref:FHA domain-containing protein n=2 Tax=Neodothiora populina TaxID=2781224 RepID=A0ABR3P5U2_9PEZI
MTAVAPPLTFQAPSRTGWSSNGSLNSLSHEELTRALNMQNPPPRKTAQRANSTSSLNSASSASSALSAASVQTNGTAIPDVTGFTNRKKGRQIFVQPTPKAEPTAGLSTARPQVVSSASSGPSAASAVSALQAPMLPSQQMTNGQAQQNGTLRNVNGVHEPTAILHLLPMNGTFERKTITVPFFPDVLRIGRQTNQKTAPTPSNAFFDSKVLSRQHAEIYAERSSGRVFIRDVKSSNGTFVNGQRLSPENKESEPHPLQEQDVLELGIDIVSEDQKTVVHHKVAARVEHAGIYAPSSDMPPNESEPLVVPNSFKRNANGMYLPPGKGNALTAVMQGREINGLSQYQQTRPLYPPITTETIVKRLNRELNLAKIQSQDLARSKQCLESLLNGDNKQLEKESRGEKPMRPSPVKSKSDLKSHFSEPPAPPPQQPLPEKPDVAKALADPVIQPLLLRADVARSPMSSNASLTRPDHSQALLILTQELKLAKDQIPSLEDRVKILENELKLERTARESAEERAQRLETTSQPEEAETSASGPIPIPGTASAVVAASTTGEADDRSPDLQAQLDRLRATMDEMKQHMEAYHRRAEIAESERDEARQTLAEMIEQKRKDNAEADRRRSRSRSCRHDESSESEQHESTTNGHAIQPSKESFSVTALLQKAGVHGSDMLTDEHVAALRQLLSSHSSSALTTGDGQSDNGNLLAVAKRAEYSADEQSAAFRAYAWYWGPTLTVLVLGALAMAGLDKMDVVHR